MLNGSYHPGVAGSPLMALLATPGVLPAGTPPPAVAERLGHWLRWTGAISLAAALEAAPRPRGAYETATHPAVHAEAFERVRAALQAAIDAGCGEPASAPADFAPYRRHCLAQQQAMQNAVAALRRQLRDALALQSPALARLAAIDAVMDQALAAEERQLLGLVLRRLQSRFDALHASAGEPAAALGVFHQEMARLLRAELAHRLLPAQGLLAALQAGPSP